MDLNDKLKLKNEIADLLKEWSYYDFGFNNEDQVNNLADKLVILLERRGLLDKESA